MESTSVSVGKFPFEYLEEQILAVVLSVGPVEDLKLLFEDLTGKSKGFAIVKYIDNESAASAVRNLNYMVLPNTNNRFLRCTFVDDLEIKSDSNHKLPPLPLGTQIYANQTPQGVISDIVNTINSESSLQILQDIKKMAITNPELTKVLFDKFPQLTQALVELSVKTSTTNTDLIELTLNKKFPDLTELDQEQVQLLRNVVNLTEDEVASLDELKQDVVKKIKEYIKEGKYGEILSN